MCSGTRSKAWRWASIASWPDLTLRWRQRPARQHRRQRRYAASVPHSWLTSVVRRGSVFDDRHHSASHDYHRIESRGSGDGRFSHLRSGLFSLTAPRCRSATLGSRPARPFCRSSGAVGREAGQRPVRASVSEAPIQRRAAFSRFAKWHVSVGWLGCGRAWRFLCARHVSTGRQRASCGSLFFERRFKSAQIGISVPSRVGTRSLPT